MVPWNLFILDRFRDPTTPGIIQNGLLTYSHIVPSIFSQRSNLTTRRVARGGGGVAAIILLKYVFSKILMIK